MKILKARNGIALVAVLVIMLISSLFIPVMFNLSDTSLAIAIKGTDRQRVSYLARTITEMSVAAFKSFESNDHVRCASLSFTEATCPTCGIAKAEADAMNPIITAYNNLINKNLEKIDTEVIVMFQKADGATKNKYYIQYLDEKGNEVSEKTEISYDRYRDLAQALAEFNDVNSSYKDEADPYKLIVEENVDTEDIKYVSCTKTDDGNGNINVENDAEYTTMVSNGYTEVGRGYCTITYDSEILYYCTNVDTKETTMITEAQYNSGIADVINGTTTTHSYSKKENKNVKFVSTAEVKNYKSSRTCILVLPTYPSEEGWFEFGVADPNETGKKIASGGNQIFVDPDKATARVPVEFRHFGGSSDYVKQNLLVYSAVGNMVIRPTSYKDAADSTKTVTSGEQNSEFVLGVQPGLNTTPNDDPTYEIIDAVNYNNSIEVAQMNNFVAFAATNALQVDMPVNLLVNPCRANRAGDNKFFQSVSNASLFKIMMFQAPVIQFNGRLDMMMSFYQRGSEEARRMSSVMLSAPSNTPYSYYNTERDEIVKAGMVFFEEDCYLWIIEPMDDGSSSSGWGFLAETVYKRDSDFKKIKIAEAGDVYYFNSEVELDGEEVGFSLTAYYIETVYLPSLTSSDKSGLSGWWQGVKGSFFEDQITKNYTETYVADDWYKIGNLNYGSLNIEPPEADGYYTYWVD